MSKKREIILTLCGLVEAVTNLSEYLGALNSRLVANGCSLVELGRHGARRMPLQPDFRACEGVYQAYAL